MAPLLYLISPADIDPAQFPRQLMAVLSGPEVAALLLRRGSMDEASYAGLAERVVQIGQAAGAAVLLENDAALARSLGADGVHVSKGGTAALRAAADILKPDGIVGAGSIRSRHDAMSFGELDVDYVMFGPLGGTPDSEAADMAAWWAENFEVPAVFSHPAARPEEVGATAAEFIALSDCVWSASDPAGELAAFDRTVKEQA